MVQEADKTPFALATVGGMFLPDHLDPDEAASMFEVFPNPSEDKFTLSFSLQHTSSTEISLFDMQGKLISKIQSNTLPEGEYRYEIILPESQPSGSTLMLVLKINGRSYSRKLMIL
jgi:hypothetical protein